MALVFHVERHSGWICADLFRTSFIAEFQNIVGRVLGTAVSGAQSPSADDVYDLGYLELDRFYA